MSGKLAVFPRYREPWSTCTVCGFNVPRSRIRLHRRFGWVCLGSPGANCWDYGPQKDEIFYTPRPFEGTRKTAAPIVDPNEGTDNLGFTQAFFDIDIITGQTWQVTFANEITVALAVGFGVPAWILNGGYELYIANGEMQVAQVVIPNAVPLPAEVNLVVVNGELVYTPPA